MLSTNTHLQKGRYRIHDRIGNICDETVYHARDCLLETNVYIVETPLSSSRILTTTERESRMRKLEQSFALTAMITNERLVRNTDHFVEVDRFYVVARSERELSSPLKTARRLFTDSEVAAEIRGAFSLIADIRSRFAGNVNIEISPTSVRVSENGTFNLIFQGHGEKKTTRMGDNADIAASMSYAPLESIWPQLDSASKKAIGTLFDDAALDTLESPCDSRSELFSVAAIIYRVATGQTPPGVLDRAIQILDGGSDPLDRSTFIASGYSDRIADFFMRAMSIRREDRYLTAAMAMAALSGFERGSAPTTTDETDLLELPPANEPAPPRLPSRRTDLPQIEPAKVQAPTVQITAATIDRIRPTQMTNGGDTLSVATKLPEPPTREPDVLDSTVLFERPNKIEPEPTPKGRSLLIPIAAVLAVGLIAIVAVVFVFKGNSPSTVSPSQTSVAAEDQPTFQPAAVAPEPTTTPETATKSETTPIPQAEDVVEQPKTVRPAIADTKSDKKPTAKADVKPEPKPKKSMTVDDLISDN
ncbi:MAG: hypothetical protein IPN51_04345 [Chloracidobacterium sp.]|nr:hypothetical protein [Chloracidobacterium sp.]